jgi:protein-L-isoaspartate(D-aspartate) O-methyltransferase
MHGSLRGVRHLISFKSMSARAVGLWVFALALSLVPAGPSLAETPEEARRKLVQEELIPSGISHPGVLHAIENIARHEFVPASQRSLAYYDMALPIGWRQTISSPFIVAFMTQSLDPQPTDRVLEIGTGSGYQAAVLSRLVAKVYSIEIIEPLGRRAQRTLRRLGYDNVALKFGDGYLGWDEHAPFDKIIVTCSPENVPRPLIDQLGEGGIMVIPVGERYQQTLYRFVKKDGELIEQALQPTLFVPMTGQAEEERSVQPDPHHPTIVNGSFEQLATTGSLLAGWYYQRQVEQLLLDDESPTNHVARFFNQIDGRSSHALQGFGVDGQTVAAIRVSGRVRGTEVTAGGEKGMQAMLVVSFYDRRRVLLEEKWLGPWNGTFEWLDFSKTFTVPPAAREALLRIGLFGATGELLVDDLVMTGINR